jgi:hypothetical protein
MFACATAGSSSSAVGQDNIAIGKFGEDIPFEARARCLYPTQFFGLGQEIRRQPAVQGIGIADMRKRRGFVSGVDQRGFARDTL